MVDLAQAINALNYVTTSLMDSDNISEWAMATSLADVVIVDIKGIGNETTLAVDETRLYRDEIIENNKWVEELLGVPCKAYAYAGDASDATTLAFMKTLDGSSSGQKIMASRGPATPNPDHDLESFDIFNLVSTPTTTVLTLSDEDVPRVFFDLGYHARLYGEVYGFYMHMNDFGAGGGATNLTTGEKNRFRLALQSLKASGVSIVKLGELQESLLAMGWGVNSTTKVMTKTIPNNMDFRVKSEKSPLVRAGTGTLWNGLPCSMGTIQQTKGVVGSSTFFGNYKLGDARNECTIE
jgi:hypothetical protein